MSLRVNEGFNVVKENFAMLFRVSIARRIPKIVKPKSRLYFKMRG